MLAFFAFWAAFVTVAVVARCRRLTRRELQRMQLRQSGLTEVYHRWDWREAEQGFPWREPDKAYMVIDHTFQMIEYAHTEVEALNRVLTAYDAYDRWHVRDRLLSTRPLRWVKRLQYEHARRWMGWRRGWRLRIPHERFEWLDL